MKRRKGRNGKIHNSIKNKSNSAMVFRKKKCNHKRDKEI
jgi:hypothetical protein